MALHSFRATFVEQINLIQGLILNPCKYSSRKKRNRCKVQNVKRCRTQLRIGNGYSNFKRIIFGRCVSVYCCVKLFFNIEGFKCFLASIIFYVLFDVCFSQCPYTFRKYGINQCFQDDSVSQVFGSQSLPLRGSFKSPE